MIDAEIQVFGATHAEVGAYLLGLWGLPNDVVRAVAYHHFPQTLPGEGFTALTAVHAANSILRDSHTEDDERETGVDLQYLSKLGLADKLSVWQDVFGARVSDLAAW